VGPVSVKGLSVPINVFELTGASPVRSRLQAAAARGLTRFVGRATEAAQLEEALEQSKAGRRQIVAAVGEPGVGKSRLFWEFTHSHRIQGCLVLETSSVSYGKAMAYLPVVELLKGYFQLEPRDDARKIGEKVTGKMLSLDENLGPALPAVLSLLDVPVEDPAWQRLDPAQRRRRTLDGIKALLIRESQVQPIVVIFEDFQWIDSETQALLDSLVDGLPTNFEHLGVHKETLGSAEDDSDTMCLSAIGEHDAELAVEGDAIDLHRRHSARHTPWVLDDEVITRGAIAEHHFEAVPRTRDTRVDHELRAA
jgi:hypothetical protein